jgi:hypothetical protein
MWQKAHSRGFMGCLVAQGALTPGRESATFRIKV